MSALLARRRQINETRKMFRTHNRTIRKHVKRTNVVIYIYKATLTHLPIVLPQPAPTLGDLRHNFINWKGSTARLLLLLVTRAGSPNAAFVACGFKGGGAKGGNRVWNGTFIRTNSHERIILHTRERESKRERLGWEIAFLPLVLSWCQLRVACFFVIIASRHQVKRFSIETLNWLTFSD